MAKQSESKRGHGDDSIYWDKSKNRYVGAISDGFTPSGKRRRPKVSGKTKTEVRKKLRDLRKEMDAGTRVPTRYTTGAAVQDWLRRGLPGRNEATIELYRGLAATHVIPLIGKPALKDLTADDVDDWVHDRAEHVSTRTLRILHSILRRAITHAQRRDRAVRNVALLVATPEGLEGRESKSLALETAKEVLVTDQGSRTHAYVVTSLLAGARTEEMRALTWQHVHSKPPSGLSGEELADWCPYLEVWRSVRRRGDTKTRLSRRTLALPTFAAEVLDQHRANQQAEHARRAREWTGATLVFATRDGGALAAGNMRRDFRKLLKRAGVSDPEKWTPRELRTSFVSLLADHGLSSEDIAPLVGHRSTLTTEIVYRKQLRPVINKGARVMDDVFADIGEENGSKGP